MLLGIMVMRLSTAAGMDDHALLIALLAASMTVGGLFFLTVIAVPLNRTHEALEASRERTRNLLEQAPDGIFVADLGGRYIDVNTAGCRMLDYSRGEIIGKTMVDLLPPEDVERFSQSKALLLSGEPDVQEWTLKRKDGSYLPVEVSARILPDGRWQGLARDISERKRLERSLQRSHAELTRAQTVASIGSWQLDVHDHVLRWSDEEYRIFGVSPGTPMSYEAFLGCVHPDDRAHVDRNWAAALRGEPYDIEHRITVNGDVKWVREKADLELDERGVLLGGVGITQDITQRKRHEEEQKRARDQIRESEERLELALRGADLAAWDWNVETGEVIFNARWAEMRGFRPDQVRPHVDSWVSGIHPDDMPHVQKLLADHFQGLTSEYRAEFRVRTQAGQWLWITDLGRVFARDERGAPTRMVGVELDISERRRLEEELRIAEAKSSGILSISADAIISVDEDQRITLFNAGAEKVFGYTKSEAIGAPLDMLIPARYRSAHGGHVERFADAPETARSMGGRNASIFGLRKDGQEFPADAAISRLEVGGKRILTVDLRDVTQQKQVENEQKFLAELGAVLASTIDCEGTSRSIAQLIVGQDLADVCIVETVAECEQVERRVVAHRNRGNEAVAHRLEQLELDRHGTYLGSNVFDTKQPSLMSDIKPEYLESIAQSDEHRKALRELSPQSLLALPLLARGHVVGSIVAIRTTAGRKYAPEHLPLLESVALRAALAVEKSRLYEVAQRAVQLRDDVLGVVAHDLRNPLSAILMQAALLRRRDAEPESGKRKPSEVIERAATRMNRLIQDLLDVARMEGGRLSVQQECVSARQALLDCIQAEEGLAASALLELRLEAERELPEVWADRDRLLQVFDNLIGNAIKFTDPGGHITLGAAPAGKDVLFWVKDTGAGIAADDLPQVFERFWQAHKAARHGAGLGLPIVKGIVEAHGGRIWVESEVGQGTTFFFTLPTASGAESWRPDSAPQSH
jgi:PAS domain S-box-containing protein